MKYLYHKGSVVVSPHTGTPWEPLRVTEVASLHSGRQMLRIARLKTSGWVHASGFLPAPVGATWTSRGRWVLKDGADVTPKLADLEAQDD